MKLTKTTVLHGYYRSGDHECFCFDRFDSPDAYSRFGDDTDALIAAQNANRVYPHTLCPEPTGYGRWTITVAFEPLEPQPDDQADAA